MPMRVLYVDDDRVNALLFDEACRLAGQVELECVPTGEEAVALVPGFRPDLLVIDLHLPDTTGDVLLPRLRAALPQGVPAYLCTAETQERADQVAAAAGFDGVWTKPVDMQAIIDTLQRLSSR
jgi:two-component system, OmpR family, response regulator